MSHLHLSDGTVFSGEPFGAAVDTDGEVVFNTSMVGYPESLTDPSYRGQILVFTYPLIGNYGVPSTELNEWGFSKYLESEQIQVRGIVCAQVSDDYSHHAAEQSLQEWMEKEGIPGISGVDTRALTQKLREEGVMLGALMQGDTAPDLSSIEDPNVRNLVAEVSCEGVKTYEPSVTLQEIQGDALSNPTDAPIATIVAYDCGMKRNIIRSFLQRGVRVHHVPWDYNLASSDLQYDGVFISNGPGDPMQCDKTIEQIRWSIDEGIPTFGICLGNQLLALAIGGKTYKLPYGHRGANQPCVEEGTDRCIITSQNHGFAVDEDGLPDGWQVWFRNANDDTVEGIRHSSGNFFSVQFHPEACPGPEDANYLFDVFVEKLKKA